MKYLTALLFLFFFGTFATVGYVNGRAVRSAELSAYTVAGLRLEIPATDEGAELVWVCQDSNLEYSFNVNTNVVRVIDKQLRKPDAATAWQTLAVDGTLIKSFLGGITAWTVKDAIAHLKGDEKGKKAKQLILWIAGGISGYSVGDYLAGVFKPKCSDRAVQAMLAKNEAWVEMERIVWIDLYSSRKETIVRAAEEFQGSEADRQVLRNLHMILLDEVADKSHDIGTKDFIILTLLAKPTQRLVNMFSRGSSKETLN